MNFNDTPDCKRTVKLGNEDIELDSNKLRFNETNVNEFMERLAIWYDYYGQKLAEAESVLAQLEDELDVAYAFAFEQAKADGGTEKLADAKAKQNPLVISSKQAIVVARLKVTQLKQHLRAWDKAHENLQSRGHMLRKEMDKLHLDISGGQRREWETEVDKIVGRGNA